MNYSELVKTLITDPIAVTDELWLFKIEIFKSQKGYFATLWRLDSDNINFVTNGFLNRHNDENRGKFYLDIIQYENDLIDVFDKDTQNLSYANDLKQWFRHSTTEINLDKKV